MGGISDYRNPTADYTSWQVLRDRCRDHVSVTNRVDDPGSPGCTPSALGSRLEVPVDFVRNVVRVRGSYDHVVADGTDLPEQGIVSRIEPTPSETTYLMIFLGQRIYREHILVAVEEIDPVDEVAVLGWKF